MTQVLDEAAVALPPELVARERVRASYAGLRVLPAGDGTSASAPRETVFTRSRGGMLNVAGGKLTTYRRIALEALSRLRGDLGLRRIETKPWPLPGATGLERPLPRELDDDVREHLLHLYGSLAHEVSHAPNLDPTLLERLHPHGPDIAAQVRLRDGSTSGPATPRTSCAGGRRASTAGSPTNRSRPESRSSSSQLRRRHDH